MKIVLICGTHQARILEEDWSRVSPKGLFELDLIPFANESEFPVQEILEKCADADAIGWWWQSNLADFLLDAIDDSVELKSVFSNPQIPRHAFVPETHHRIDVVERVKPYFQKLYVAHRSSLPREPDTAIHWLPCACPITVREAETLMHKPVRPNVDIVFPYTHYFIGDRAQRLTAAIRRIKAMELEIKCGTYYSSLGDGYVYDRNYHNILASGRVALNLSTYRDLNQRLFEANLIGATVLSEHQPDHDHLEMDRSNSFFFNSDLLDFDDTMRSAMAHERSVSPPLDIRNRHLDIHRLADFLSTLSGMDLSVEEFCGLPRPENEADGEIGYELRDGDAEYTDLALEIWAMQSCLYNRIEDCISAENAFRHLVRIVEIADPGFGFEGIMEDVFHLAIPLITPPEMARITASNQVFEYRANVAEGMKRFENLAGLCRDMRSLILNAEGFNEFRRTFNRGLRGAG